MSTLVNQSKPCSYQNILILPSQPVDGDSLGSALAMYRVLQAKGKNVTVVLTAEVPEIYKFMPGTDIIQQTANVYSDFVVIYRLKRRSGPKLLNTKL